MTMGTMARVSTGHTGRNLNPPPNLLSPALLLLALAGLVRVFFPATFPEQHSLWINLSGGLWVIAFALLCLAFIPVWSRPRVDGKYG